MADQKWILTSRQRCDLEMLLIEGFKPLAGFLSQADYENVLATNRLINNHLWPIPITLDVCAEFAEKIIIGHEITLCDNDNSVIARMRVTDKWQPNKSHEAEAVFGTTDMKHPGVNYLFHNAGAWYLGGPIELVQLPKHYDFTELRYTPQSLKEHFLQSHIERIVGFQTRNPIHRAHMALTLRAAKENDAHILIHPVVGMTKPNDVDYFTRVRCYQKILPYYPSGKATLSLLPLAMRMAGPKEALWHALIRKNYGCTHFIVGRDHAGPGNDSQDKSFYDPYDAQKITTQHQEEIGIKIVTFQEMVYVKERKQYFLATEVQPQETACTISGTKLRDALLTEAAVPEWFSFPEVMSELRQSYLPKHKQGFTLFLTGLSGSGKTALAKAFLSTLMSQGKRNISLLDGDVIRQVLGNELGFSKADRCLNVRRMGFVANEVTKAGGIALCAAIAPYAESRAENRKLISQQGGYIEVYVSTPLAACEKRDPKGLYAKARKGDLKNFTGIDDPYEIPDNPEITIDTSLLTIEDSVKRLISYLQQAGYLKLDNSTQSSSLALPDTMRDTV